MLGLLELENFSPNDWDKPRTLLIVGKLTEENFSAREDDKP